VEGAHQSGWWFAIAIGLFGALYAGLGAVRALRVIHAAVWEIRPERMLRPLHASAALLLVSFGLLVISLLAGWARERSTVGGLVATLTITGLCFVLWLRVSLWLPHRRVPVRALVPGAALVAVGVEALHLFTVYYLDDRADRAQSVYGAIGAALVLLLWLFILARLIVGAAMVNAELAARSTARAEPESADAEQP
jgi:membrane protein